MTATARWLAIMGVLGLALGNGAPVQAQEWPFFTVKRDRSSDAGDIRRPPDDVAYPLLRGDWNLTVETDQQMRPPPGQHRTGTNTYASGTLNAGLFLDPALSLQTTAYLGQVKSRPTGSAFFGHAVYLPQLYANYEGDWLTLWGGKFYQRFGTFSSNAPGLFGASFVPYSQAPDSLGAAAEATIDAGAAGTHLLSGSVWMADISPLSTGALVTPGEGALDTTRPYRTRLSHGGMGNSGRFNSYTLSLRGHDIAGAEGLSYNLDLISLAPGHDIRYRGTAAAFGLVWTGDPAPSWTLTLVGELAGMHRIADSDGNPEDGWVANVGAALSRGDWTLSGVAGHGRLASYGDTLPRSRHHDQYYTTSIEYKPTETIGIGLGAAWKTISGKKETVVGIQISFSGDFLHAFAGD